MACVQNLDYLHNVHGIIILTFRYSVLAHDAHVFNEELAPVKITVKRKEELVACDEHPRPQTTIENLKKLPPVFQKEGLVTAGSASVS